MSSFRHIPLGEPIPNRAHAVSCSLPTMGAVIGYEEKDPAITRHLSSGYPRFVKHPYLKRVALHILAANKLEGQVFWPTSTLRAAKLLQTWMRPVPSEVLVHEGVTGVHFADTIENFGKAKTFLQHTGMLISTREAEDYLVRVGELKEPAPETTFEGYAASRVKGALIRTGLSVTNDEIFLANSGMNAVYSAFRTIDAYQRERGRRLWIQLGWLYLDTIHILQKFTQNPETDYLFVNNVFDFEALKKIFAQRGGEIAGIITEVPTNPLVQTGDLPALHQLCRQVGAALIVDPTIACLANLNVLEHSDVVVTSLTKFAASEGDLTAGAVILNPESPWCENLRTRIAGELEPLYSRDLSRLAFEIGDMDKVMAQTNASTPRVAAFLESHPKVESAYWSLHEASCEHYLRLAKTPDSVGSMITFTIRGDVTAFYDRLKMAKGPSFGMKNSLICPFMYLAHYDLVTTEEGRAYLAHNGLHPQLLRLSLGTEPAEEIIEVLREALG